MDGIIVKRFFILPEGAKTTRKRNKFLGKTQAALVLSGDFAARVSEAVGVKEGMVDVCNVPLESLMQLAKECAGNNPQAYRTIMAVVRMNFLEEDINAILNRPIEGVLLDETADNT